MYEYVYGIKCWCMDVRVYSLLLWFASPLADRSPHCGESWSYCVPGRTRGQDGVRSCGWEERGRTRGQGRVKSCGSEEVICWRKDASNEFKRLHGTQTDIQNKCDKALELHTWKVCQSYASPFTLGLAICFESSRLFPTCGTSFSLSCSR